MVEKIEDEPPSHGSFAALFLDTTRTLAAFLPFAFFHYVSSVIDSGVVFGPKAKCTPACMNVNNH